MQCNARVCVLSRDASDPIGTGSHQHHKATTLDEFQVRSGQIKDKAELDQVESFTSEIIELPYSDRMATKERKFTTGKCKKRVWG